MGNSNSRLDNNVQQNAGNVDFDKLQSTIEKLVKSSQLNTEQDSIKFTKNSDSELDINSIKELLQNGGSIDSLNIHPRRNRYANYNVSNLANENSQQPQPSAVVTQSGGGCGCSAENAESEQVKLDRESNFKSINEKDLTMLQNVLNKNKSTNQTGGCGCADNNGQLLSITSPQSVNYDVLKGGSKSNEQLVSETSPQPIDYNILKGGSKSKTVKKDKADKDEDDQDEDMLDDENDKDISLSSSLSSDKDAGDDEDDEDDDDEDDDDDIDDSATDKKMTGRQKNNYLETTQEGASSSEEIRINKKLLYSDNSNHYGSDDSDYYKMIKNKSMFHQ